jgi:hypothetical protein
MLNATRAILDLKNQRDKLHQYQKRITTITTRETEIAKECLRSGHKEKALLALRRKKYQESLLSKTDQQLAQLQALTSDVEFALIQKDVLFGLQQGTAVLKEIHKEMGGLEKVEMILSESEEARAYQQVKLHIHRMMRHALTGAPRKLTICSAGRYRVRMKTRSRMSLKRWSVRLAVYTACQTLHLSRRTSCRMLRSQHHKLGRRQQDTAQQKR